MICSSHLSISCSLFAVLPPDAYRETLWVENGCTRCGCFQSFGRKTALLSCPLAQSSYRNSVFSLTPPCFFFPRNSVCSELFTNEAKLQGNCNHISHSVFLSPLPAVILMYKSGFSSVSLRKVFCLK